MTAGTSTSRTRVASIEHRDRQAEADLLDRDVGAEHHGQEHHDHDGGGGGDHPRGAGEPAGDSGALSPVRSYSSRIRDSRNTS